MDDLTPIGDVLGKHRELRVWPPLELSPGIAIIGRDKKIRDPKTQELKEIKRYAVPCVLDSRLYYFTLNERNKRIEDEKNCPTCNGASFVRHGELVPGQPGFGGFAFCPNWRSQDRRCVWHDSMGFEVTR